MSASPITHHSYSSIYDAYPEASKEDLKKMALRGHGDRALVVVGVFLASVVGLAALSFFIPSGLMPIAFQPIIHTIQSLGGAGFYSFLAGSISLGIVTGVYARCVLAKSLKSYEEQKRLLHSTALQVLQESVEKNGALLYIEGSRFMIITKTGTISSEVKKFSDYFTSGMAKFEKIHQSYAHLTFK